MKAVLLALTLMVIVLLANTLLASDKIAVLVMTFIIGMVGFSISTPLQMAIIKASRGSVMLGSSMNQSAFNMGNATGNLSATY